MASALHLRLQPKRMARVTLRLSFAERARLNAEAQLAGLCLSAYLRWKTLRTPPHAAARRPTVEARLLADALTTLGDIASALRKLLA